MTQSLYDLYLNPARNMGQQTMGQYLGPQQSPFPWQQQQQPQADPNAPPQGYWSGSQFQVPGIPNLATPQVPQFGQSAPSQPSPTSFGPRPISFGGEGADSPNEDPMSGVDVPDMDVGDLGMPDFGTGTPASIGLGLAGLAFKGTPLGIPLSLISILNTARNLMGGEPAAPEPALGGIAGDIGDDPGSLDMSLDDGFDDFGEAGPGDFGTTGDIGDVPGFNEPSEEDIGAMGGFGEDLGAGAESDPGDTGDAGGPTGEETSEEEGDPFHKGGHVKGTGEVKARLRAGEYVVKKRAVDYYGPEYFDRLNALRVAKP